MKTSFSKSLKCSIALIAGWIAAVVPEAIDWVDPHDAFVSLVGLYTCILLTGALVVPCWLLLAVPLVILLRSASDFWRFYVSVPFGGITGLIISYAFSQIFYTDHPYDPRPPILLATFSGALSGATTLGVVSCMNSRERKLEKKMAQLSPETAPTAE